jgi:hypothetical protein
VQKYRTGTPFAFSRQSQSLRAGHFINLTV